MGDQIGIGDQHARGIGVGFKHGHRFAGLHKQSFIISEILQCFQDGVEALPIAGSLAAATINYKVLRAFGDLRVEVVLNHSIGGFGLP
jgi:hypothetical protein